MPYWILRCRKCGREWRFNVSYNLKKEFTRLYHYCPYCRENTFHDIIEYVED